MHRVVRARAGLDWGVASEVWVILEICISAPVKKIIIIYFDAKTALNSLVSGIK